MWEGLISSSIREGLIELKYTGGFDRDSSSIREGLIELKYTGGFDRAQVYGRV